MNGAPDRQDSPPLQPGSRVGHYEILAELGRGGMGVVYRARDQSLDRQVALKTPHAGHVADEVSLRRFLRTARLSAGLSHGHIVTIFEVFEEQGVPWLVMELIEGEPLSKLLATGKPLPVEDITRHATDLASALQLAHRKRILHRDVKPGNVLIGADGRALLMDFGLAGFFVPPEDASEVSTQSSSLTTPGAVVGTMGYMAPEQLLGKPADPRSDLFSLGAVLYEMATGRAAFTRSGEGAVVDRILHHEPEAIARLNYEAPDELARIIRKCLAKEPGERYQRADELLADLRKLRRESASGSVTISPPAFRPALGPGTRIGVAVLALALVAMIVFAWLQLGRAPFSGGEGAQRTAAGPARASVAVLPFADQTGEPDGLLRAAMLADLISARTAESARLRPLSPARVQEVTGALPASEPQPARAARVAHLMDPDWLVTGTLYREGSSYEASVEVSSRGRDQPALAFRASAAMVTALVDLISGRIEQGLFPAAGDPASTSSRPPSAIPERPRLLEYRGKEALREARYLEAVTDLEAAIQAEPRLVSAYGLLSRAYHLSGYTRRAIEAAESGRRIAERQETSTRDRLLLQAAEARVRERSDEEVEILQALAGTYPDDTEVLRTLAAALRRRGEAASALPRIEQALALDPSDPRLSLERGEIAVELEDANAAQAAFQEAERLFTAIPSPGGRAEVAMARGRQSFRKQAYPDAGNLYREAVDLFEQAGQAARAVSARKAEGDAELYQGNLESARSRYEPALAEARRHGNILLVVETLNGMGAWLISRGRYEEAERSCRMALEEARRIENPGMSLQSLNNLSSALGSSGRPGESRALAQEALVLARERGDRDREAFALSRIGDADFQLGDLSSARASYQAVVSLFDTPQGSRTRLATGLASLGGVLHAQNRSAESLALMGRALAIERDLGRKMLLSYYLVSLAGMQALLARYDEASASLAEAEELASAMKLEDVLPRITLVRGQALALQGRWAEALVHLDRAREAGRNSQRLGLETMALIVSSHAHLQEGNAGEALRRARAALEHRLAFPTERVLARVELSRALAAQGDAPGALSEARRALDEATSFDSPLVVAHAAAAALEAGGRTPDAPEIARRGREALEVFFASVPPEDREAVRARADIAVTATVLGAD